MHLSYVNVYTCIHIDIHEYLYWSYFMNGHSALPQPTLHAYIYVFICHRLPMSWLAWVEARGLPRRLSMRARAHTVLMPSLITRNDCTGLIRPNLCAWETVSKPADFNIQQAQAEVCRIGAFGDHDHAHVWAHVKVIYDAEVEVKYFVKKLKARGRMLWWSDWGFSSW